MQEGIQFKTPSLLLIQNLYTAATKAVAVLLVPAPEFLTKISLFELSIRNSGIMFNGPAFKLADNVVAKISPQNPEHFPCHQNIQLLK